MVRHYPDNAMDKLEEVSYLLKNGSIDMEKFIKKEDIRNYKEVA